MVRYKRRYIVVEYESSGYVDSNDMRNTIKNTVEYLHGSFGLAAVQSLFDIMYFNSETRIAILGAHRGPHQLLLEALPQVKHVKKNDVTLHTRYVTGSMRHGYLYIKKYQEKHLAAAPAHEIRKIREGSKSQFFKKKHR